MTGKSGARYVASRKGLKGLGSLKKKKKKDLKGFGSIAQIKKIKIKTWKGSDLLHKYNISYEYVYIHLCARMSAPF